jgi:Nose resistant-to-fluoxetine protein, N-terminal domain
VLTSETNKKSSIPLVHDATAKIPSGIFNGNLNQYGDYDQCLSVASKEGEFDGKYCIAYLQPRSRNGTMKDLLKLVQSHEFFKSNFNDVRFPGLTFRKQIFSFRILKKLTKKPVDWNSACFFSSADIERLASATSIGPFVFLRAARTKTWSTASRLT